MSYTEKIKDILIKSIKKNKDSHQQIIDLSFKTLDSEGYVIPMVVRQAIEKGNEIVDKIPYYSSADHNANLKVLLTFIAKSFELNDNTLHESFFPYFDKHIVIDPIVEAIYETLYNELYLKNCLISIKEGYWNIRCKDNLIMVSLSEPIRRSALTLLANKVSSLSESNTHKYLEQGRENINYILLTQSIGLNELEPILESVPDAWNAFLKKANLNNEAITEFPAFFEYLKEFDFYVWYRKDQLWYLWTEYVKQYSKQEITKDFFFNVLDFFSIGVKEAIEWGIGIPFIKIGQWYFRWPFYHHILHPNLSLLALLIRKYSLEWSETVGSQLEKVSSYLADTLPSFSNIIISTLKKKKKIGDIDLAIYNQHSKHLIICEIKTVFDRFRTNYQLTNFKNQRVNFERANNQLDKIENAILKNMWNLSEIFEEKLNHLPKFITKIILTWWDVLNLNLGTSHEDTICCNFKTFQYLYSKANGNLELLRDTIYQLSKIYCTAHLKKISNLEKSIVRLQIQTDIIPPLSYMKDKNIRSLVIDELKTLKHIPEDFEQKDGDDMIHIYHIPSFKEI